jgi:uracil-DNA glycosylase family 4
MKDCDLCKRAYQFNYGLKGRNADNTRFLFILNRADKRLNTILPGLPTYETALRTSATGSILEQALEYSGLTFERIYITNFFKCLLPQDASPGLEECKNCLTVLNHQIAEFQPKKIIAFGNRPYQNMFPEQAKKQKLTQIIGTTLEYQNTPTLIMIHPSQIWKLLNPEKQRPYFEIIKEFLAS